MSKISGPSRIPKFGSSRLSTPQSSQSDPICVSNKDLGRKVRIGDKEGLLRYVGSVQFAPGVWCGIELTNTTGKHDGFLHGIRYFACQPHSGLMAPQSKVQLAEGSCESLIDDQSGPYSILFSEELEQPNKTKTHRSCDNLPAEAKRRKTSKTETPDKTNPDSPIDSPKFVHSTPVRNELSETILRKLQPKNLDLTFDEDSSKRDSLEFEESLGILTPDQMIDGMTFPSQSRSPSLEGGGDQAQNKKELLSPNPQEPNSITDLSLGIIDEHVISNLTLKTDTTINLDLPLDTIDRSRLEQTPSPEELPLDPTPIPGLTDQKAEPKSKTTNSFITSITSITSLDTGYQGDGEMSRPASRGADNSPLTRRPIPRTQARRPDPMTDSDFYTESDADGHEDNVLKGDRKAQVIDGTLYGMDPQAAADIYANNRENMDSSGVFTDIETPQNPPNIPDVSPSDTSTKTISEASQNGVQNLDKTLTPPFNRTIASVQEVDESPDPKTPSQPSKRQEIITPKYSKPKEIPSKIKALITNSGNVSPISQERKKPDKKPAGRWDAVMNKISKNEPNNKNFKDVKSKVCTNVAVVQQRQTDKLRNKINAKPANSVKSPNVKALRMRPRTMIVAQNNVNTPKTKKSESSIHSSLSDLSANGITARKNVKKSVVPMDTTKPKRSPFPKDKKFTHSKECGRGSLKGGRTSPIVRSPSQIRANHPAKKTPQVVEALAVLVQHLVFNVEAYQVPKLKIQSEKYRKSAEEYKQACQQLEELLAEEQTKHQRLIQEEKLRLQNEVFELEQEHQNELEKILKQQNQLEERVRQECQANYRIQINSEKAALRAELLKLQKIHEEALDILREENEAIREQIDEKRQEVQTARNEFLQLKQQQERQELSFQKQFEVLKLANEKLKEDKNSVKLEASARLAELEEENQKLREENNRLLGYGDDKEIGLQEVQSLRAVLELKQTEVGELRRALATATQKAELLEGAEERAAALNARCEDLQHQLQRKAEHEQGLLSENQKLQDSFKEEVNQKRRLSQYNEELQWKLKQNKEVMTKVLEHAEESGFNRSNLSFNERHSSTKLERTQSFRERSYSNRSARKSTTKPLDFDGLSDESPPTSPKIKGVVEKSDSVSYVLDMDDSPDVVASRIVRRSFRNSTTPIKRPNNPLSLSASVGALVKPDTALWRKRSFGEPGSDMDEEFEALELPALPSELVKNKNVAVLPCPKHLAGEAMVSESNSEDESSTSSSQL